MDKVSITLKVFFEDPFYIGLFERIENQKLSVWKITFGQLPNDSEIYDFILKKYNQLQFSPNVQMIVKKEHVNPKRKQREIHKEITKLNLGTKSQQALKKQHEQNKIASQQSMKEKMAIKKKQSFEQKQQKKKKKHRGR